MTHKGAAADSGHYIGFVKKRVFHAAKAKANLSKPASIALPEGILNALSHVADPAGLATSMLTSRAFEAAMASNPTIGEQGDNGPSDSNSAAGPSTTSSVIDDRALELEEDEDWYKFDDEKVTNFPKEKLPTLEGGGEDSSAYVLVYRSKVL